MLRSLVGSEMCIRDRGKGSSSFSNANNELNPHCGGNKVGSGSYKSGCNQNNFRDSETPSGGSSKSGGTTRGGTISAAIQADNPLYVAPGRLSTAHHGLSSETPPTTTTLFPQQQQPNQQPLNLCGSPTVSKDPLLPSNCLLCPVPSICSSCLLYTSPSPRDS